MRSRATFILSNGDRFEGDLIGAPLSTSGELVFTTAMVGYTEALTDPSYYGQILIFSYPLIGNYGVASMPPAGVEIVPVGFESRKVQASAVIVAVDSPDAYHWNSFEALDQWLKNQKVPGIVGLDTRHLIHLIRQSKGLFGRIEPDKPEGWRLAASGFFDPSAHDLMGQVSCVKRHKIGKGKKRIALIDCGVKWNIIRRLLAQDCEVELLPWDTDLSAVDCDAWLISNGPGDPARTGDLKNRVGKLLKEERPILGICLGHQILALAAGATTARLPYGHRSHNQPVYEVGGRKGLITSQNHGYVVVKESLPKDWKIWFLNANDETIEGIRHAEKPFRSIQFHPEAAGGPRDSGWIIDQFVAEVKN